MASIQPPIQVGGAALIGAAGASAGFEVVSRAASELPRTGTALIQTLVVTGVSLIGTGAMLVRRGRGKKIHGSKPFD